jgi:site-specific DNA-cytosine methylase
MGLRMRMEGETTLRVLVACEFSGIVRDAFRKRGHDAVSCDLLPTEIEGSHIQDDVLKHLSEDWDLMIAHPPCTHLAVSGAAWFKNKGKLQKEALDFVKLLMDAPIPRICIENPVSIISTHIRKPDQIIQPYQFGEPVKKTTCLWLKNLPKLKPTSIVEPEITTLKTGAKFSTWDYKISMNHKQRSHLRSVTFLGIAEAMADQWSSYKPIQTELILEV